MKPPGRCSVSMLKHGSWIRRCGFQQRCMLLPASPQMLLYFQRQFSLMLCGIPTLSLLFACASPPVCRRAYDMEAVYVHDAAALAAVVDPTLFDWEAGAVVVVTDGPAKGRTIRDEGTTSLPARAGSEA